MVPYNFGEIMASNFHSARQSALQRKFEEERQAAEIKSRFGLQAEDIKARFGLAAQDFEYDIKKMTLGDTLTRGQMNLGYGHNLGLLGARYGYDKQLQDDQQTFLEADREDRQRFQYGENRIAEAEARSGMYYDPITNRHMRIDPAKGVPEGFTPRDPFGLQTYQMSERGRVTPTEPKPEQLSNWDIMYNMVRGSDRVGDRILGGVLGLFGAGKNASRYYEEGKLYNQGLNDPNWWAKTYGNRGAWGNTPRFRSDMNLNPNREY